MKNTIATVVNETLTASTIPAYSVRQYQGTVDAIVEAVSAKVAEAVESLREQGRSLGASDEQIEDALVAAGLVEVEPEPEVAEDDETPAWASGIKSTLDSLVAFARSNGYRG